MTQIATCRLCLGTEAVLSLEHVPPKSVGNEGRATVRYLRQAHPSLAVAEVDDGIALNVLCERCNNVFGSRLGTTFSEFAKQVQASGRVETLGGSVYVIAAEVFPSRVIRQLLLNYLCIHLGDPPPMADSIRAYIKSRVEPFPSDAPRIALYYNASATYRVVPTGVVNSLTGPSEPWMGAEVAAPGLGVVFTVGDVDTSALLAKQPVDVTEWAQYRFDQRERVLLRLPRFRVEVPHPLGFGTPSEVDRWQTKKSIAWLASTAGTEADFIGIGALWRTGRGRQKRRSTRSAV